MQSLLDLLQSLSSRHNEGHESESYQAITRTTGVLTSAQTVLSISEGLEAVFNGNIFLNIFIPIGNIVDLVGP